MGKESNISWCESTWNPWHGCEKVSTGCKYCYMFRDKERYGLDPTKVIKSKGTFNDPSKWKEPRRIFTCSWSDWFIEEADEWREEAWKIIKSTPQHTYQILTKKPYFFHQLIEQTSPGRKIELFAREQRGSWDVWGNEVKSNLKLI